MCICVEAIFRPKNPFQLTVTRVVSIIGPSLRQALQNIISRLINRSSPRKSAYRALPVFCRSGEAAGAAAPIKRSVLNPTFKTEGFIGAAAPAAPPLHQKMLVRDRP